jgi:hypothetical protein
MYKFVKTHLTMKGFSLIADKANKGKILQIEVKELVKNPQKFEDMIDVLIAEERRGEKSIPWEEAKKQLRKAGKL